MTEKELMREAINLATKNIENGGGPFGAVIASKEGEILATGVNRVTSSNDPTAHAEVMAIRNACDKLKTFDLSNYNIFSSCEPCPMCLGAIYWAHLDKLYFGNTKADAKDIGFDDSFIYDEISLKLDDRKLPTENFLREESIETFKMWSSKTDKIEY
ncbi:MAG: nucleoside deaminase [Bacteroidetes bacterium]|nr:nucleoside deaminase [Bacteroidota bacterium]